MQIPTQQEINAILALLGRLPMTPAEGLFVMGFFNRLNEMFYPPQPKVVDEEIKSE